MKTLHRNKRKIYICELYNDDNRKRYKEPIELFENWQVTSTDAEFMNLGLEAYNYVRIRTSAEHSKYFHLGDRAYINVPIPDEHDSLCKTADYEVYTDPITTLNECTVLLKKLSGRSGNNIY